MYSTITAYELAPESFKNIADKLGLPIIEQAKINDFVDKGMESSFASELLAKGFEFNPNGGNNLLCLDLPNLSVRICEDSSIEFLGKQEQLETVFQVLGEEESNLAHHLSLVG